MPETARNTSYGSAWLASRIAYSRHCRQNPPALSRESLAIFTDIAVLRGGIWKAKNQRLASQVRTAADLRRPFVRPNGFHRDLGLQALLHFQCRPLYLRRGPFFVQVFGASYILSAVCPLCSSNHRAPRSARETSNSISMRSQRPGQFQYLFIKSRLLRHKMAIPAPLRLKWKRCDEREPLAFGGLIWI
jgi:hypothetical protein